ncbi:hypothetical protein BG011_008348 [Mortierella polycephala]|uniref:Uncharacterized protein n=1 Tax=Mortierella polycephala TaxID=41804 RepID=A0A9P6PN51_9FUNG|nr:hypothetical protein BG011_008348 [Mortierella polycephala]
METSTSAAPKTSAEMTPLAMNTTVSTSSSTPQESPTMEENVKNLKRKVISVSKLMGVFENKEQELAKVRKELEEARKEITALRAAPPKVDATVTGDIKRLSDLLAARTQQVKHAKLEADQAKERQSLMESSLARMTQQFKAMEMLKNQTEMKFSRPDKVQEDLNDAHKKVAQLQKDLDQTNRRSKQETSQLREKLMRASAEIADRKVWQEEQKKKWENEEARRTQHLERKIVELEEHLNATGTEQHLEMEFAKDELKDAQDELARTGDKLRDANDKIRTLHHTIIELRVQNGALERKLEHRHEEILGADEFEEINPNDLNSRPSASVQQEVSPNPPSDEQLQSALDALKGLTAQFSVLRWVQGSEDDKQRTAALEAQIKTLMSEKQALQDELTHQLTMPKPTRRLSAPTASDTVAAIETPKKKNRKRVIAESMDAPTVTQSGHPNEDVRSADYDTELGDDSYIIDHDASSLDPTTSAQGIEKKLSKRRKAEVAPRTTTKKPRSGVASLLTKTGKLRRRTTKSKSAVDITQLEIRNISLVPSIANPRSYFSLLMNSAFVHDSQAFMKLDMISNSMPDKLNDLLEAVKDKAKDIADEVGSFRQGQDLNADKIAAWTMEGYTTITISASLCPSEVYIVQLLCLVETRLPEMKIVDTFFHTMYDAILLAAPTEDQLATASVLVRVVTGVCRALGDIQRPRILAYDLLREISKPKSSLVLCEAMASVWPLVFMVTGDITSEDPQRYMLKAWQAVLGTLQEASKDDEVPFGFDTFTKKCGWPHLDDAPFVDELAAELMSIVRTPEFTQSCTTQPGYEFTFRKALELLFIHGYEWIEVYNDFIKPELSKMMLDGCRYAFATPLVASVTRETRSNASKTDENDKAVMDAAPIRLLLEAVLDSEATLNHQVQSALAIVVMSNGQGDQLEKVKQWYGNLKEGEQNALPAPLQDVLA